jgi:trimethyllysine dioxygenase
LTFKDTAYTADSLGAHTDNTYFTDPPRLQLFHLLSHTNGEGGATLLIDGFKAARQLMEEDEPSCRVLAKFSQPFHSSGNEHVCIQPSKAAKVFERDIRTNELQLIRWNNYDRGAKTDWTIESEELWYNAARHWNEIITHPEMEIWLQLQPGTTISIYALSSSKMSTEVLIWRCSF